VKDFHAKGEIQGLAEQFPGCLQGEFPVASLVADPDEKQARLLAGFFRGAEQLLDS
jgi:hypothetical protein